MPTPRSIFTFIDACTATRIGTRCTTLQHSAYRGWKTTMNLTSQRSWYIRRSIIHNTRHKHTIIIHITSYINVKDGGNTYDPLQNIEQNITYHRTFHNMYPIYERLKIAQPMLYSLHALNSCVLHCFVQFSRHGTLYKRWLCNVRNRSYIIHATLGRI